MKIPKISIQIRPLIWVVIPMYKNEDTTFKRHRKAMFLCFEFIYFKDRKL